jgi:hypothetical protein
MYILYIYLESKIVLFNYAKIFTKDILEHLSAYYKTNIFFPTRGIRQGDPLSPYLFVICMERLSHITADQVEVNYWKPQISHLLFADDLHLLAEASIEQAHYVMHCLDQFCQASGQKINNQKTQKKILQTC